MEASTNAPTQNPAANLVEQIQQAYINAGQLPSAWVNEDQQKVERPAYYIEQKPDGSGVRGVYRWSAVMDCPRALWAARNLKVAVPVYDQVRKAAKKGHEFEPRVQDYLRSIGWEPLQKAELEAMGYKVDTNGQVLVETPVGADIVIRGHVDNIVRQMTPVMGKVKRKRMETTGEGKKQVKKMVEFEEDGIVGYVPNLQGELRVHEGKAQILMYVKAFMRSGLNEFPRYKGQFDGYRFSLGLKGIYTFFDPSTPCDEENTNPTGCFGVHKLMDEPPSITPVIQRIMATEQAFLENKAPDCGVWRQKSSYVCNYRYLHDEPAAQGTKIPAHPELEDLITLYKEATASEGELEAFKKRIQENVKEIMGNNKTITAGRWKPQLVEFTSYTFDETRFFNEHPELYKEYVVEKKSKQFRVYENKDHDKEKPPEGAAAQALKDLEEGKFLGPVGAENPDLVTPVQAFVQQAPIVAAEVVQIPEAPTPEPFIPAPLPAEAYPEPAPPIPPPVSTAIPPPVEYVTCPSCLGWGGYSDGSVCQVCAGVKVVIAPIPESDPTPHLGGAPGYGSEVLPPVNAGFGWEDVQHVEDDEPGKDISGAGLGPANAGTDTVVPTPPSDPSPSGGSTDKPIEEASKAPPYRHQKEFGNHADLPAESTPVPVEEVPCIACEGTGEINDGSERTCPACMGIAWFHPDFKQGQQTIVEVTP